VTALTDREVAYVAVRIGAGIYMVKYSFPMLLMTFNGHMAHQWLGIAEGWTITGDFANFIFGVFYFVVLVAGLGLLLGFKSRWAAVIGVITSLPVASVMYALVFVGLVVFRRYNRLCLDKVNPVELPA